MNISSPGAIQELVDQVAEGSVPLQLLGCETYISFLI
jgi:hypothetical protein